MKPLKLPNYVVHLAVWGALFVAYLPFFLTNHVGRPLERDALGLALLMGLYYANARLLVPRLHERGRPGAYWLAAGALVAGVAALRLGLDRALFGADWASGFPSGGRYGLYVALLHGLAGLVSYFVAVLGRREAEAARAQAVIAQQQAAELQHLRAQINPHFLFNTLNNLYALTVAQAPEAPEMVLRLAALLRYAIYSTGEARVPVRREIAHIRELLWLYQRRFEQPVAVTLAVDAASDGAAPDPAIEPMLLLPLVENCLKHSDLAYNPGGYVRLRLRVTAQHVVFETENTHDPAAPPAAPDAHGVGLANLRQRLRLAYGPAAGLRTTATPTTFAAALHLPLPPHADAPAHPAR